MFTLAALLLTTHAATAQTGTFTVGIVEANGNVVPIAEFNGTEWTVWSTETTPGTDPEPLEWTLRFENPGPIEQDSRITYDWIERLAPGDTPFGTSELVESVSLCSTNLAIRTTLEPKPELIVCEYCCPETKRGIATTGLSAPLAVEGVDPGGDEGRLIATLIAPRFGYLETQAVEAAIESGVPTDNGQLLGSGQPVGESDRADFPIRIDRVSRVPIEESLPVYYVEARRNYGATATDAIPCPGYSYLRTWIWPTPTSGVIVVDEDLQLFDCDMKGALYDTPLVYWPRDGAADVFFRQIGWESEAYGVITVSPSEAEVRAMKDFRQ